MKKIKNYIHENCSCFSKDTIITVKENNVIVKKKISEVKIDDNILTLFKGQTKFTKVKSLKLCTDESEFYEFKCMIDDKIKSITVTNDHIMIVYNKDMTQLQFKTADSVLKEDDYFLTIDGLYQIKEINSFNGKGKYMISVDEGAIIANDILVTCLIKNDFNKQLNLNDMSKEFALNIL